MGSRTDFGGIDNAALDFSQLEDYINDEDDNNGSIYFADTLSVSSDLRIPESPHGGKATVTSLGASSITTNVVPAISRSVSQSTQVHQVSTSTSPPTPAPRTTNGVNTNFVSCSKATPSQSEPSLRHSSQTVTSEQSSHNSLRNPSIVRNGSSGPLYNKTAHPHNLPESPPDSGSEPPYSPPNDENRLNATVANNITLQSNQQSSEMLQSSSTENLRNYVPYGAQLKHLPPTDLNLIHHHASQHANMNHLNPLHPIGIPPTGHHQDGSILTQLNNPMIPGPLGMQPTPVPPGMAQLNPGQLTTLYGPTEEYIPQNIGDCSNSESGNHQKKRKISTSSKQSVNGGIMHIKQEPGGVSPEPSGNNGSLVTGSEEDYGFDYNSNHDGGPPSAYMDSVYQCIRFQPFQASSCHTLCDSSLKELPTPHYRVDADKGFNFSNADDAFVCQKKNHFQVTVHIQPIGSPKYVKTPDGPKKIDNFFVHFYGVKVESPTQTIKVEQSQSDRSKKPFHPVLVELIADQVTKTTVGRLHFSETTSNNMRKKGKPNPDQRYFYLVVSLCAHVGDQSFPIVSHASERIIVRASNPGQFENDMELSWQKGHTPESIYHAGRVGINTDRPDESLVVHGNVKITGHIIQPSDTRAKTNIEEIDTRKQLKNVANIRVVRYKYTPEFASKVGLSESEVETGVLAQEVQQILPDAVKATGDIVLPTGERIENFLVVNKERIFMENVGAVKELCKVTDNLETRIDELERMNNKIRKLNRFDSIKSIVSTSSINSTATCNSSYDSINRSTKRLDCKKDNRKNCHKKLNLNESDGQVCTNRFMQTIIMILVLIMAFCLASIATLYILEYHKRHNHLNAHPPNGHNSLNVNNQAPASSTSPIVTSSLQTSQENINIKDKSSLDSSTSGSKTLINRISQRPTSIPILKTQVLGTPHMCRDLNSMVPSCQIYCCSIDEVINIKETVSSNVQMSDSKSRNSIESEQKFFDSQSSSTTESNSFGQPNSDSSQSKSTTLKTSALNQDVDSLSKKKLIDDTVINSGHSNNLNDYQPQDIVTSSNYSGENNDTTEHQLNTKQLIDNLGSKFSNENGYHQQSVVYSKAEEFRDKREAIEDNNLKSSVNKYQNIRRDLSKYLESIKIVEFNATIGREFCTTLQCVQKRGPKFEYNIPVSKFMTHEFVTLQFSLSTALKVDHCEYKEKPSACPSNTENIPPSYHRPIDHIPTEEISPSFKIPVGLYLKSTFVFRILAKEAQIVTALLKAPQAVDKDNLENGKWKDVQFAGQAAGSNRPNNGNIRSSSSIFGLPHLPGIGNTIKEPNSDGGLDAEEVITEKMADPYNTIKLAPQIYPAIPSESYAEEKMLSHYDILKLGLIAAPIYVVPPGPYSNGGLDAEKVITEAVNIAGNGPNVGEGAVEDVSESFYV
ncbi:myelin regulatory factor-like protein [Dinothrombium tinctorium]|uniref:Myelin regulatory factor-like protein n=1 Tax=Dinothrombium tinctorium TaxID=1965070 RepID=A0A3S3P945_9ACAR|nr:myelin regulatory factor-like protein [Dinothrombium tinctorium]